MIDKTFKSNSKPHSRINQSYRVTSPRRVNVNSEHSYSRSKNTEVRHVFESHKNPLSNDVWKEELTCSIEVVGFLPRELTLVQNYFSRFGKIIRVLRGEEDNSVEFQFDNKISAFEASQNYGDISGLEGRITVKMVKDKAKPSYLENSQVRVKIPYTSFIWDLYNYLF